MSDEVDIPVGVDAVTGGGVPPVAILSSGGMTAEQRAKLQSELDVVQGNMAVLGEMLSEVVPGKEQPGDLELLQVSSSNTKTTIIKTLFL